jgi:hypothetical protein
MAALPLAWSIKTGLPNHMANIPLSLAYITVILIPAPPQAPKKPGRGAV